jgi:hypothetical protein
VGLGAGLRVGPASGNQQFHQRALGHFLSFHLETHFHISLLGSDN